MSCPTSWQAWLFVATSSLVQKQIQSPSMCVRYHFISGTKTNPVSKHVCSLPLHLWYKNKSSLQAWLFVTTSSLYKNKSSLQACVFVTTSSLVQKQIQSPSTCVRYHFISGTKTNPVSKHVCSLPLHLWYKNKSSLQARVFVTTSSLAQNRLHPGSKHSYLWNDGLYIQRVGTPWTSVSPNKCT